MRAHFDLNDPSYNPRKLLRAAAVEMGATSVSNMAEQLGFAPANMTRVIKRKQRLSGDLIVAIMDATGWSLPKVRELAGLGGKAGA